MLLLNSILVIPTSFNGLPHFRSNTPDNLVPKIFLWERPWYRLVKCLPESGRLCFGLKAHLPVEWLNSKETPKKVYRSSNSSVGSSACRLCRAVGDTSHRKNIFKPSNKVLLEIAEQICKHSIVYEANLPHLICRPCECRLNNTRDFQKVILETEQSFWKGQAWFKRCQEPRQNIEVSTAYLSV